MDNVIVAALGEKKKKEGPLRDFNRKQKKINGREKNATEFPVLP